MATTQRVVSSVMGLMAATIAMAATPPTLTVKVQSPNGAPRLMVNGEPVRARMFWGGPGSAPIKTGPQWEEKAFEFVAAADAPNGTMHFRFGQVPGDVYLDDVRVVDRDSGKDLIPLRDFEGGAQSFASDWTYWPTDQANTVGKAEVAAGAMHVALKAPPGGVWPDYHIYHQPRLPIVKGRKYRASFRVKSEPARSLTVAFYRPGQTFTFLGGPEGHFASQIKLAAGVGVNFVSFPMDLPWPEPGKPADFSAAEAQCETVLRANPKALLLPRISMEPPAWWRKAYPDDVMQWEDGRRSSAVVASPRYRLDAAERLSALVRHMEEKLGEHVAGYHPTGQNTGEWFYHDTWKPQFSGYAQADLAAWRGWLQGRYGTDAALAKGWNDPAAQIDAAAVPTPAARRAAPAGVLRDPATERPLIDWAEFQQQAMADCICELAKAVRTASRGQKLVVFFYGYGFEFAMVSNGPSVSGHYALRRALDCPDIDVLCAPISYHDRGFGEGAPAMTAAESVALAGKMWLNEDDTHTYLATEPFPGHEKHVTTLEATNQQLVRNVAQESLRNFGTWWMDLGSSGWFDDAGMWKEMRRLEGLDAAMLATPTPYRPEVAAILDERSVDHVAAGGNMVTMPGVYEARRELGRMGASYGQYLLDDLLAGKVKAKVYVILNAWRLTAPQRAKLLEVTRGATVVWCYAPGYVQEDGVSPDGIRQLTGFAVQRVTPANAAVSITETGAKVGMTRAWGPRRAVTPLFAVTDAKAEEILATYADGSAAVAFRRTSGGTSIFAGPPGLTSELLRMAVKTAGVHLFTENDCNVYASGRFLTLHASQDGPLAINTGQSTRITDMLTGETLGTGPRLTLLVKRGETRVLSY